MDKLNETVHLILCTKIQDKQ